jgi:hypothetical protein
LVLFLLLIHFLHLSTYDFLSLCCLLLASCFKLTGSMMKSQISIVAADLWHVLRLSFFCFELSTKLLSKHDQVSPFIAVRIMLKEGKEATLYLMKKLGYWVF